MTEPLPKNFTTEFQSINVHQLNGDLNAIEFLKNADDMVVEGMFLRAKLRGQAEFRFHGQRFVLRKNRDLTYTVETKQEQASLLNSL